ncbi:MAG: DUF6268 family outer membrane beta-barrel protein [Polyangiales bacterium]
MKRQVCQCGAWALWLWVLGAAVWQADVCAQTPHVFELHYQYLPNITLPERGGTPLRVQSFDTGLHVPIPLPTRGFVMPGIHYHADALEFARTPSEWTPEPTFHALELPVQLMQLLAPNWRLQVRVVPELAGDFRAVDSRMFRLSGYALVDYRFSQRLALGVGAGASYLLGSLLPLPFVYVVARPHTRIALEGFLPAFANAKFLVNEVLEVGLRAELAGHLYAVRDTGRWPCVARIDNPTTPDNEALARTSQCFDNLAYSVASVGVQVALQSFGAFWLTAYFGRTVYRRFEQRASDGDRIPDAIEHLPDAFLLRFTLSLRLGGGI